MSRKYFLGGLYTIQSFLLTHTFWRTNDVFHFRLLCNTVCLYNKGCVFTSLIPFWITNKLAIYNTTLYFILKVLHMIQKYWSQCIFLKRLKLLWTRMWKTFSGNKLYNHYLTNKNNKTKQQKKLKSQGLCLFISPQYLSLQKVHDVTLGSILILAMAEIAMVTHIFCVHWAVRNLDAGP